MTSEQVAKEKRLILYTIIITHFWGTNNILSSCKWVVSNDPSISITQEKAAPVFLDKILNKDNYVHVNVSLSLIRSYEDGWHRGHTPKLVSLVLYILPQSFVLKMESVPDLKNPWYMHTNRTKDNIREERGNAM